MICECCTWLHSDVMIWSRLRCHGRVEWKGDVDWTKACISILPGNHLVYYKRVDLYLCSAKAPVLEGSGSRRLYRLKGTSIDRVYV